MIAAKIYLQVQEVARDIVEESEVGPEQKSFEKCFVYFVTLPKQLTTIKCIQKETEEWVVIFSKTADFLSFYKRNQTTIVTSFYPKSP